MIKCIKISKFKTEYCFKLSIRRVYRTSRLVMNITPWVRETISFPKKAKKIPIASDAKKSKNF